MYSLLMIRFPTESLLSRSTQELPVLQHWHPKLPVSRSHLVSAMLAAGLTLKDIPCGKYGTLDKYVPDGDYVVIKFARWAFEKFKGVEDKLRNTDACRRRSNEHRKDL